MSECEGVTGWLLGHSFKSMVVERFKSPSGLGESEKMRIVCSRCGEPVGDLVEMGATG